VTKVVFFPAIFLLTLVLTACQPRSLYDWGSYNAAVHRFYNNQDTYQNDVEVRRLALELSTAKPERIPPGKSAHLGYLYTLQGDSTTAEKYFTLEKELFPESAVFMDRVIAMNRRR